MMNHIPVAVEGFSSPWGSPQGVWILTIPGRDERVPAGEGLYSAEGLPRHCTTHFRVFYDLVENFFHFATVEFALVMTKATGAPKGLPACGGLVAEPVEEADFLIARPHDPKFMILLNAGIPASDLYGGEPWTSNTSLRPSLDMYAAKYLLKFPQSSTTLLSSVVFCSNVAVPDVCKVSFVIVLSHWILPTTREDYRPRSCNATSMREII